MATCAPSAARRLAIATPIPREPPLTRATFRSSFLDIGFSPIPSITLFADPVSYVGRAVEKCGASCFTSPKEADDIHTYYNHSPHAPHPPRPPLAHPLLH